MERIRFNETYVVVGVRCDEGSLDVVVKLEDEEGNEFEVRCDRTTSPVMFSKVELKATGGMLR